jgi:glycine dehydrogenase
MPDCSDHPGAGMRANGEGERDVCLIPSSAHGTNPASAVMAGMKVVVVGCDDARQRRPRRPARQGRGARDRLAALMVTYPSTHGVFEAAIREICAIVHEAAGRSTWTAPTSTRWSALARPGDIGADVCHMNLHKTFCIPHGGGGPGVGPIGVGASGAVSCPITRWWRTSTQPPARPARNTRWARSRRRPGARR